MENEKFKKEFRVLNLSIEKLSLYYGIFLIIWGILIVLCILEAYFCTEFEDNLWPKDKNDKIN